MPDLVQVVGRDAGPDVAAYLFQRLGGEPAATRIRAIVSASLTSGSPSVGCFLPTYSGRTMFAGTCRVGESRPGWSKVAMFWESNVHDFRTGAMVVLHEAQHG